MEVFYKIRDWRTGLFPIILRSITVRTLLISLFSILSITAYGQTLRVTGVVTDAKGETLPLVSIKVKGTSTTTSTDLNGKYTIAVPSGNALLVFTYVGFETREMPVAGKTVVNAVLQSSNKDLEEVVVVAYGTQKKASLTAAISTVKGEEILKSPTSNVTNSLAGRLAGVTVIQRNGQPGLNGADIRIRGVATPSNSAALIFVDGVERATFGDIDPNEIETISTLKDASATALYGIRGANGVIIVTTRGGKEGRPKISYSSNVSIQTYTGIPKQLNAYDNARLMNEAMLNDGLTSRWTDEELKKFQDGSDPYAYPDVNWFDYVTRKYYPQTQHNLNVSGGTSLVKYFASVGYLFEDGIFRDLNSPYGYKTAPSYNRYNFRSNVDFNFTKNLTVGVRLGGRLGKRYQPSGPRAASGSFSYDHLQGVISRILQTPAFAYAPELPGGLIAGNTDIGTNVWNPLAVLTRWGYREDENNAIESVFNLNYKLDKITRGLSFKGLFSYDSYFDGTSRRNATWAEYLYDRQTGLISLNSNGTRINDEPPGAILADFSGNVNSNIQLGFNYAHNFGRHNVSGMLQGVRQLKRTDRDGATDAAPFAMQGIVTRSTYNYAEKYYLEFNLGYNGSEQFSGSKKYGFFPAYSAGWTVSNEHFLKGQKWLSYFKIRGSYGKVGNDNIGNDRFLFLTRYQTTTGGIQFGIPGQLTSSRTVNLAQFGNPGVEWETGTKRNLGFESRFLRNRLSLTADVFDETRSGILFLRSSSQGNGVLTFGEDYPAININKVYNKGYEIELSFNDRSGQLGYGISSQMSYAKNKYKYADDPFNTPENLKNEGQAINQHRGYLTEGFFNSVEEVNEYIARITPIGGRNPIPGDLRYKDVNGDKKIDQEDRVPIGYSNVPEYNFSITPNVSWKGLSLSVMFQGVANVSSDVVLNENNNGFQMYEHQLNRWTEATKTTATWPALHFRGSGFYNYQLNDFILQNASYIKLRNVEFAWSLPKKWLAPVKLSSARIFANGQNLHTWTKFKMYLDPEQINTYNTEFSKQSIYPSSRIYNVGVNLQF